MTLMKLKGLSQWGTIDEIIVEDLPFTVGRHPDCMGQILHPLVSRQHCRFFMKDKQVWIEDLDSVNGTTLNGMLVREPKPLNQGDVIGLPCNHFSIEEIALDELEEVSVH